MKYVIERLQEASSWRGAVLFITGALGVTLPSEVVANIVTFGVGLAGLIGMATKDKQA